MLSTGTWNRIGDLETKLQISFHLRYKEVIPEMKTECSYVHLIS
jgi:hypothetical protein